MTLIFSAKAYGAILLVAAAMPSLAQQLELKGIQLGIDRDALEAAVGSLSCASDTVESTCSSHQPSGDFTTLAGYGTDVWLFNFRNGKLVSVSAGIEAAGAQEVAKELRKKYGAPHATDATPVTNAFGVRLYRQTVVWKRGSQNLGVIWNNQKIGDGRVTLYLDGALSRPKSGKPDI